ncbi:AfsR/SARP family transcriptional regulator [Micromonospora sp. C28SCA-DRY-2]|uniref:AfsR/SARP family transcriptional regulator n=1 Tax=Micromonospora sp. C28SCA-DRY-2 TaxID=3059522 RepID=UPI0026770532|nr:AfsR/SARP family transcriptional regulator [Micromonospora sp. C28SCA-DRY-2]MDO3703031.1 AfsR/SARP family transcriptional regulator [Micromonospora sp. C28SCA-DRY-2]
MSRDVVDLHLLGPVAASRDGTGVPLGPPKQRAVLAALALEPGRLVPTNDLVDAVWGDRPPAAARKAVQVYVSQLRRALPTAGLRGCPPGYVLDLDPERVDVHRFRRLVTAAEQAGGAAARDLLGEALALWRGGVPLAGLGEDAPLARALAPVLVEERLSAVQRRLTLDLDAGHHREVVGELVALTTAHPIRESLVGLLMRALAAAGRPAEAVAAYRRFDRRLRRELGAGPGEELRRLHHALRDGGVAGEPAAAPTIPAAPAAPAPEIERIDDRELVAGRLWALARDAREVLTVHRKPAGPGELARYLRRLRRGDTRWRTVVHRSVLSRAAQLAYSLRLHRAGDRHRVTDRPVRQMVILDRRIAVVPAAAGAAAGALVIRNPGVAATLADLFEHTWAAAVDLEPATPGGGAGTAGWGGDSATPPSAGPVRTPAVVAPVRITGW